MISLEDARNTVLDSCSILPVSCLPLHEALGCVAAESVRSRVQVPPFANSAMDGFALRTADTDRSPVTLRVVATTLAGMAAASISSNEVARIMTGAALPSGADGVCMIEETTPGPTPGTVVIRRPIEPGEFVRGPGSDIEVGDKVLGAGAEIGPAQLGVLASLGEPDVRVHRRPRVGVLSTGDELTPAEVPLAPGHIRDANRPSILGLLRRSDFVAVDLGVAPDDRGAIASALVGAAEHCDAVVASGGVSVGDADVVKEVLAELCGDSMSWMQIAIKPAKPFAFGLLSDGGIPLFGVPGNPVSAMVSFELLVRPALRLMAGHRRLDRWITTAVADEPFERKADGKTYYLRAQANIGDDGQLHLLGTGRQQSHVLSAMARANALAIVPDGAGVRTGERVRILVLDPDSLGGSDGGTEPW